MSPTAAPVLADGVVTAHARLGPYTLLAFRAPEIATTIRAGQFVDVRVDPGSDHLLRRPFSVCRAYPDDGIVEIAFDVIGPGTSWLDSRRVGDRLDVAGPLGTPFTPPAGGCALLVGGGYGTAALFQLAAEIRGSGGAAHLITGARTASRVMTADGLFDSVTVVTEDGSAGVHGLVTDAMPGVVSAHGVASVSACGPMAMLAAVSRVAAAAGLPCEAAAEEFMACGVGVCWTCVVPVRTAEGVKHVRCCTEGPVFDASTVEWR